MTMKYWVGEHYVDRTRNQITHRENVQILAPKALSVLTLLAENQGLVVTQEEILNYAWEDAVVTQNNLQRSIAQLRKAFGDDAKQQKVIKTHPKQGYSLELEVNWCLEDQAPSTSPVNNEQATTASAEIQGLSRKRGYVFGMLAVLFVVASALVFTSSHRDSPSDQAALSVTSIQAMTATDASEFNASYTANNEYLVFTRNHQYLCAGRIWAKHIASQQETVLTPSWGNYGGASLSPDGSQLVFTERPSCQPPLPTSPCYRLKQLDFQQALAGNTQTTDLTVCSSAAIKRPLWLSDKELVFMHNPGAQWQLLKYSLEDASSEILYQPRQGSLHTYDLSRSESKIALVNTDENNRSTISFMTLGGTIVSRHDMSEHPEIPQNKRLNPRFVPNSSSLIFSTGRRLFTLSAEGKLAQISLALDEPMSTPQFNQKGTHALVTKGNFDSDIGTITLPQTGNAVTAELSDHDLKNIARTNSSEEEAIFHPDGQTIAFNSARSGTEQLWLSQNNAIRQLTKLPLDSWIRGFRWAKDGQSLLLSRDGKLIQVWLDGRTKDIAAPGLVSQLFFWNSDTNMVIANLLVKGTEALSQLNLTTGDYQKLKDTSVYWADRSDEGRLVYLDFDYQFWQSGVAGDVVMTPLNTYGSFKRFYTRRRDHLWHQ